MAGQMTPRSNATLNQSTVEDDRDDSDFYVDVDSLQVNACLQKILEDSNYKDFFI